jgi:hypothetical protein
MNSNNPSEQRAYQRRLKRLRARDRRYGDYQTDSRRIRAINEAYDELRQEYRALDGDLRPAPGRRNREIDDGGLD